VSEVRHFVTTLRNQNTIFEEIKGRLNCVHRFETLGHGFGSFGDRNGLQNPRIDLGENPDEAQLRSSSFPNATVATVCRALAVGSVSVPARHVVTL
jgi:hypothetical protein